MLPWINTEQGWLIWTDCDEMLRFLQGSFMDRLLARLHLREEKISRRKLRLYYCACARNNALLPEYLDVAEMIEAAERHADGETEDLKRTSGRLAHLPLSLTGFLAWRACDITPRFMNLLFRDTDADGAVVSYLTEVAGAHHDAELTTQVTAGRAHDASLLRDIFGNPFRRPAVDESWLTWSNGVVRELARNIYDERNFGDLPILADALEEAGCRDEMILSHCREATAHARGCWLIDLLLGKR